MCDTTMAEFVERAPDAVQVVISSRTDPGLPVARLRAHGDLVEIRERDLRVSPDQAAALFRGESIDLADVELLTERTEGWLAGLCLARIVVTEHEDPRRFVADFSGDSRLVLDYLADDVLDAVPPELRDFLVRSSILERLSAPLCDAVLERHDSAIMLRDAEHANLFLVSLDETGSEYRYHQLFAMVLRHELDALHPDVLPDLHARASRWHEEHGDVEQAIEHAIASRDVGRAGPLVTRATVPLLSAGRMVTVNRWFDSLSWPEALADRELAVMRALAAPLSGHGRDEVERWLAVAEDGSDFGPLANGVTSVRSAVAIVSSMYLTRGVADAERAARFALDTEPHESAWRYACLVPLGQALFLVGCGAEARAPLEEARVLPGARLHLTTSIGLAYLALIELADGRVEEAGRLARDAVSIAEATGHSTSAGAANAHLALGCALTHSTDLHSALEHIERAVELSAATPGYWHAHALLRLAAVRRLLGDPGGALEALDAARRELEELPDRGMLETLLETTREELSSRPRREGFLGDDLSEAELRVLRGFASGESVRQVARELYLSENTVKTHRRSIYRKLGVTTREAMLARAAELQIGAESLPDAHPE